MIEIFARTWLPATLTVAALTLSGCGNSESPPPTVPAAPIDSEPAGPAERTVPPMPAPTVEPGPGMPPAPIAKPLPSEPLMPPAETGGPTLGNPPAAELEPEMPAPEMPNPPSADLPPAEPAPSEPAPSEPATVEPVPAEPGPPPENAAETVEPNAAPTPVMKDEADADEQPAADDPSNATPTDTAAAAEMKEKPPANEGSPAGEVEAKAPAGPSGEQIADAGTAKPQAKATDAKSAEKKPTKDEAKAGIGGDWPMWGGEPHRNMVNLTTGLDVGFQAATKPEDGKNLLWTAQLGSQTYGNPVISGGKVFVGTNNGAERRASEKGDRGVVMCFNEADGTFLWQLTREKLSQGRVNDWPEQGICSTSAAEGDRVWVVTNRAELMCLDVEGFHDGENDGPYSEETLSEKEDADVVWSLDLIGDLDVFPHNLATSSPLIVGDNVYIVTSNGVDEAHLQIPAPRAPSFICVNKTTGELVWESNEPFDQILHGQWSSPSAGEIDGKTQIFFAGGDGWLYAFDPAGDGDGGGKILWKFDCNPKDSRWELGGRGTRNNIISTPVFHENSVLVAVGQDPEHGEGVGHFYRIDASKQGDVSPQIDDGNGGWKENPDSAQVWHLGGTDETGELTGRKGELIFRRTISTAAVADGLVVMPDLSGFVHCVDFKTGKRLWVHDMFAACWGSPMIADGKIFIGDEDGELTILGLGQTEDEQEVKSFDSSIYSTPTIANGKMFVSDRSRLYCFKVK